MPLVKAMTFQKTKQNKKLHGDFVANYQTNSPDQNFPHESPI